MRAECKRRTLLDWDTEYGDMTEEVRGQDPKEVMDYIIEKYDLTDVANDPWVRP